jgi:hypothetical protein
MALTDINRDTHESVSGLMQAGLLRDRGLIAGIDDWLEIKYVCLGGITS